MSKKEERLDFLMTDYGGLTKEELKESLVRLSTERMSVLQAKKDYLAGIKGPLTELNEKIEAILKLLKEKDSE